MKRPTRRSVLTAVAGVGLAGIGTAGCLETLTDATDETAKEDTSPDESDEEIHERLFPEYKTTDVTVMTPDGEQLISVTAAIAETDETRRLGLSDTDSLPEDWGMLFIFNAASDRTFWMKEMDFGLDMLFVDDEKTITEIHHAPEPDPGEGTEQRYSGHGQYVLEVNYQWTQRHNVTEGDILKFER